MRLTKDEKDGFSIIGEFLHNICHTAIFRPQTFSKRDWDWEKEIHILANLSVLRRRLGLSPTSSQTNEWRENNNSETRKKGHFTFRDRDTRS